MIAALRTLFAVAPINPNHQGITIHVTVSSQFELWRMALEDALDRKEIVSLDFSTERVTSLLMFSVDGFPVRIEHNRRGAR